MARILAAEDEAWTDIEVKFIEHFVADRRRHALPGPVGRRRRLLLRRAAHAADGAAGPDQGPVDRRRAAAADHRRARARHPRARWARCNKRFAPFRERFDPEAHGRRAAGRCCPAPTGDQLVLGVIPPGDGRRVLARVFDEDEFLSPYGLRGAVAVPRRTTRCRSTWAGRWSRSTTSPPSRPPGCSAATPTGADRCGCRSTTSCCAACSATPSPSAHDVQHRVPHRQRAAPLGLAECAEDLRRRLISLFLRGPDGRRPCHGWVDKLQDDPRWRDNITFNEYFHGDNGAGLGATHQTGWTGLVADLICRPDPFAADPTGFWSR